MLFYDESNIYPLGVGMADAVIQKENKNQTKLTRRKRYKIKNTQFLSDIDVQKSGLVIKSLVKGVFGVFVRTRDITKVMILKIEKTEVVEVNTIQVPRIQLGSGEVIRRIEIIPLISKPSLFLKAFTLVVGTKRSIIATNINYWPFGSNNNTVLEVDDTFKIMSLNSGISHIECTEKNIMTKNKNTGVIKLSRRCQLVVRNYIVKTLTIETEIKKVTSAGEKTIYQIGAPGFRPGAEYMMPRSLKAVNCFGSRDYIAVLARHEVDYHMDVLVYKRGYPYVWAALYSSYESYPAYMIYLWGGRTWISVKDVNSNVNPYLIGNMSLGVSEGHKKKESLEFLYTDFGDMSLVRNLTLKMQFSELIKRKNNLILVLSGSIGGFFGLVVLLCCCCCLGRGVYEFIKRRFMKREKRWVPIVVKGK